MNAMNPFQVPTCFQIDYERRRRERFKRTFIAVVATGALVLVGLLIEGCMSEHANAPVTTAAPAGSPPAAANPAPAVAVPAVTAPVPASPSNPAPAVSPAPPPVSKADTFNAGHPATLYVVKAGDNLSRIAKAHGTTVSAIEAVNGLTTDRIAAGAKLKIPTA